MWRNLHLPIDAGAKLTRSLSLFHICEWRCFSPFLRPDVKTSNCNYLHFPPVGTHKCAPNAFSLVLNSFRERFWAFWYLPMLLIKHSRYFYQEVSSIDFLSLGNNLVLKGGEKEQLLDIGVCFWQSRCEHHPNNLCHVCKRAEYPEIVYNDIISDTHFSPNIDNNWPVFLPMGGKCLKFVACFQSG